MALIYKLQSRDFDCGLKRKFLGVINGCLALPFSSSVTFNIVFAMSY